MSESFNTKNRKGCLPLLSVIVPVYNVELVLRRCLDSLVRQTMYEIEIILVDDGSTDGCGVICDGYAEKDPRIRVIHQENKGLSAARNIGIESAVTEWIMFVDSDDWVEPDFCRIPYQMAQEYRADIIIFNKQIEREGKIRRGKRFQEGRLTQEEALNIILDGNAAVWNKLYRKNVFCGIRYPEGKAYEDTGTTHKLIHAAERVYAIDVVLYHYVFRNGSITTQHNSRLKCNYAEMLQVRARDLISWGYPELARQAFETGAMHLLITQGEKELEQQFRQCLRELKAFPKHLSRERKTLFTIYRVSPKVFDLICCLWGKRKA